MVAFITLTWFSGFVSLEPYSSGSHGSLDLVCVDVVRIGRETPITSFWCKALSWHVYKRSFPLCSFIKIQLNDSTCCSFISLSSQLSRLPHCWARHFRIRTFSLFGHLLRPRSVHSTWLSSVIGTTSILSAHVESR